MGYNIDLLEAIKQKIPLEYNFVQKPYDQLKRDLEKGEIDLMTTLFSTPDNFQKFKLLNPHGKIRMAIFGKVDQPFNRDSIHKISFVSTIPEICTQFAQVNLSCFFISSRQFENFFEQESNQFLLIHPEKAGLFYLERQQITNFWTIPLDTLQLFYGFGLNKKNDSLAQILSEAISQLTKTGKFQEIQEKWFSNTHEEDTPIAIPYNHPWIIIAIASLILLVAISLLIHKHKKVKEIFQHKEDIAKMHEQICSENKQLTEIINTINHPLFIVDKEKKEFLFWNSELNKLLGLAPDNKDVNALKATIENDIQFKKLISSAEAENALIKIVDANGQLRVFQISSKPLNDDKTLHFVLDITQRYKAEKKLEQESGLLNSIINSIPDLIFYKDTLFRYIGSNAAFKKYNNFTDEEFIGKTDYELYDIKQAIEYHDVDRKVLESGKSQRVEKWGILPNGKSVLFDTLKVPFYGKEGEILGIIGISRDITPQYEIQKSLSEAKLKAEESDKLKTIFLANISHEIRTPLNSIIGFSDLLLDPDLTDDQREDFLNMIRTSSNDLLQLVEDIIDLSKIESNQIKIKPERAPLRKILQSVVDYFEKQLQSIEYRHLNIEIEKEIDVEAEAIIDSFQVKQIFLHLGSNALKYTRRGTITIGYRVKETFVEFYIHDKNASISDYTLSTIFDRNAFSGGMENYGGAGLNLIIARGLVRIMGGEISVTRGKDNLGIVFSFFIPQAQERKEKTDENKIFEGKTLLVAEDEKNNFLFIEESLRKTGIKIFWALNGKEALEMVAQHQNIDAILMDIKMPVMDGYTATREIRNLRPDVPIIAQTAYALTDEKKRSIEAGCNAYLSKPIQPSHLIQTLAEYIKK